LSIEVARRGYPFAVVRPRGDRDLATHTINVTFNVEDVPRWCYRADQHPRQHADARLRIRRELILARATPITARSIAPSGA
jgi:outer membrane protein insertion porin family